MRCFLAVYLDEALKSRVLDIQKQIAEISDVKIVEPENLHFTLKFLGEANDDQVSYVKNAVADVAKDWQPFEINIAGLGAFPSLNFMRVVWIGAPALHRLQHAVDEALHPVFQKERNIVSHLTLARVRTQEKGLAGFVKSNENAEIGPMTVDRIKLKKSTLRPTGPVYEDYWTCELE